MTRRRGGIKRGESKLASNHFLTCAPQPRPFRDVHGVIQRREEGGGRQVARRIKWGIKRRETDPASNQFLKCFPQPGMPKRLTELGREEKGEGDRGDLVEKKESQKGERAIKPVITLLSKNSY